MRKLNNTLSVNFCKTFYKKVLFPENVFACVENPKIILKSTVLNNVNID